MGTLIGHAEQLSDVAQGHPRTGQFLRGGAHFAARGTRAACSAATQAADGPARAKAACSTQARALISVSVQTER